MVGDGFIAAKGSVRLIALQISKYLSTGSKSPAAPMGQYVPAAVSNRVMDELRAASYAESGGWEIISMGNLNDTPGRVLVGIVEAGGKLPGSTGGGVKPNIDLEIGQIKAALGSIENKVK